VIREENGLRTSATLDLTSQEIFSSPYFYIQQNDVVYVKPNKYKTATGEYNQNRSFYISLVSTAVSVATLIVTITKL
jgi:polysaccharide export outer membrane protein